ncbi:MAG: T9SS type A sorting domain-containing protein [Bacteroidota bacterium]
MVKLAIAIMTTFLLSGIVKSQPSGWEVDASVFENSASYIWQTEFSGGQEIAAEDFMAAFVDEEVRGVTGPILHPGLGEFFFLLLVYSDELEGENITFKYYDASEDITYLLNQSFVFELDATEGSFATPITEEAMNIEGGPLPVELIRFTARVENTDVVLEWSTATETNNDFFEIQQSTSGLDSTFEVVGIVEGNGTVQKEVNYSFVHEDVGRGSAYYRLRQVDYDGTSAFSPLTFIQMDEVAHTELKIYPIPADDSITLHWQDQISEIKEFSIYDLHGHQAEVKTIFRSGSRLELDVQDLQSGIYALRLTAHATVHDKKLIIQH